MEHRRDVGQPTQAAGLIVGEGQRPLGEFGVCDVADESLRPELVREILYRGRGVNQDERRAIRSAPLGDRAADTAGRTRDDDRASLEAVHRR